MYRCVREVLDPNVDWLSDLSEAFLVHLKPGYCLEIGYHCHLEVNRVSSRNIRDNLVQCCVALEVEKALIRC